MLRQVFNDLPEHVVFKGGTSLSKAYGLIDRFSEDIDLLVVPNPEDDQPASVEHILDMISTSAGRAMGIAGTETQRSEGLMREVQLTPAYGTASGGGISKSVRVESGRRGGPRPSETKIIRPWLADVIPQLENEPEFASFTVTVLHPARTLVEKLFVAKELGAKLLADTEAKVPSRQARHLDDIYRLLSNKSPAPSHLNATNDLEAIVRDSESISHKWFGSEVGAFSGSFADTAVFTDPTLTGRIVDALAKTCSELCYPGTQIPTWEEVVATVAQHRELLTIDRRTP